jgi:predicted protein tyrosine phosphatase
MHNGPVPNQKRTRQNPEPHLEASKWLSQFPSGQKTDIISPVTFSEKGQLFLSNRSVITDYSIRQNNIKAIISVGKDNKLPDHLVQLLDAYQCYDIDDNMDELNVSLMTCAFIETRPFITQYLHSGNVLVHCRAGASRSPTIVLDYLVNVLNIDFIQAVKQLKHARLCINPHPLFLRSVNISSEKV